LENESGLKKHTVPRIDNADEEDVIVEVCENTHRSKTTFTDIVKRKGKRINNHSSHSLKLIQ
jgi:hypothetical protein